MSTFGLNPSIGALVLYFMDVRWRNKYGFQGFKSTKKSNRNLSSRVFLQFSDVIIFSYIDIWKTCLFLTTSKISKKMSVENNFSQKQHKHVFVKTTLMNTPSPAKCWYIFHGQLVGIINEKYYARILVCIRM